MRLQLSTSRHESALQCAEAVLPCGADQALDFLGGQVFARAALGPEERAGAELSHFQGLAWWL
ncbi:MAG: hypothetical protein ACJ74E_12020, partial [Actinomycetes bacterium]